MSLLFTHLRSLHPLSPEGEQALQEICRRVSVRKNELLQHIGHTCRTLYFLEEGAARIFYFKGETDVTERFAFEGQFLVRYESLLSGQPSRKAIQMLEDVELIAIDSIALYRLFSPLPETESLFRRLIEKALVDQINRLESLQFHSAEERYNDLLRENPDILRRVPLKYVASYLGITPVSLSRIRARH